MKLNSMWLLILLILCVGTIVEWWYGRYDPRDIGFVVMSLIFGVLLMLSFFYWLAGVEPKRAKELGYCARSLNP